MTGIVQIISGGQTGADEGGLRAAKALGIPTGGVMAKFFEREDGYREDIAKEFGLLACAIDGYVARTRANVILADGTLVFGNRALSGSALTIRACEAFNKPYFYQPWPTGVLMVHAFRQWLKVNNVKVLNVAGNRESKNIGVGEATSSFVYEALSQ